jgi:geranylgeranyl pyrophosphate synthase
MSKNLTVTGIRKIFKQKGRPAMELARKELLKHKGASLSSHALRYLSEVTLSNALPVFPALVAMSYEAAGGNDEKAVSFGEAILLISFAADLHDDVIDKSNSKDSKLTVMGKFGEPTAILTGDILLVEGLRLLTEEAYKLSIEQAKQIIRWVSESVIEICASESLQFQLKSKVDLTPEEYYEVIKLKAVVPELCMKIGAILCTQDTAVIEGLGNYGRMYGINSVIIEEFADLLHYDEFVHRIKNEIPPLPVLYAIKNPGSKEILHRLLYSEIKNADYEKAVNLILNTPEVKELLKILSSNADKGKKRLPKAVKGRIRKELEDFLFVPLKYFES